MTTQELVQFGTVVGVAVTAVIGYLNSKKADKIQSIVNGPLSAALQTVATVTKENADLKAAVAARTGHPDDMVKSIIAQSKANDADAVNKNRIEGKNS